MRGFIKKIVFQPPRDPTCMQNIMLYKKKQHFEYVSKPTGERISFVHVEPDHQRYKTCASGRPFVILYNHGNAENLGWCYDVVSVIARGLGVAIVAYDYCGYGVSGITGASGISVSQPNERTVNEDAECVYLHLRALGYLPEQIVVMGRSLGGGPACYLAERYCDEIAGLILQSTFSSCLEVASAHMLSSCLPWCDMFVNSRRIEKVVSCPILFIHGTEDTVVPFRCSRKLLDIAVKARRKHLARQTRRGKRNGVPYTQSDVVARDVGSHPPQPALPHNVHKAANQADINVHQSSDSGEAAVGGAAKGEAETMGLFHLWVEGCDHNNIEVKATEQFYVTLHRFFQYLSHPHS